jgi:hypothetical protein
VTTDQHEHDLAAEIADRLRAAAREQVEGTTPYPRVELAVRRDRRRRATGAVVAAAALVVAATVAVGVVRSDHTPAPADRDRPTPAPTSAQPPSPTPVRTPDAGPGGNPYRLDGPAAGSLKDDAAWLLGLRKQVVRIGRAARVSDVRVLFATDHGGHRWAMTFARQGSVWTLRSWYGAVGASPAAMRLYEEYATHPPAEVQPDITTSVTWLRAGGRDSATPGIIVAVGPGLRDVEVPSRYDYTADGRVTAHWRPLRPEGAVWWTEADAAEMGAPELRALLADGRHASIGVASYNQPVNATLDLSGVAPPGSDPGVLACAQDRFVVGDGWPRGSAPVLGGSPRLGDEWYGFAVARAPGGGYLAGTCRTRHLEPLTLCRPWPPVTPGGSNGSCSPRRPDADIKAFVLPAPAGGAGRLFAALPMSPAGPPGPDRMEAVLVIAPEGATQVRTPTATAPVRDGLAILTLGQQGQYFGDVQVTAYDAAGRSLGTTRQALSLANATSASFYDEEEPLTPTP